jgi:hypothetical protein
VEKFKVGERVTYIGEAAPGLVGRIVVPVKDGYVWVRWDDILENGHWRGKTHHDPIHLLQKENGLVIAIKKAKGEYGEND